MENVMQFELNIVENGLVPIYQDQAERRVVNARELHAFIESRQDFSDWIKNRIDKYGFEEDVDFTRFHKFMESGSSKGGDRRSIDYLLTIDTAKEIAMVENNEKGREVRKYFIECEKKVNAHRVNVLSKMEELRFEEIKLEREKLGFEKMKLLMILSDSFKDKLSPDSLQALASEASRMISGERVIPLPVVDRLYSATDLAKKFNTTSNMIGRIANQNNWKTSEYGQYVLSKSRYCDKQLSVFQYNQKAMNSFEEYFRVNIIN